MMDLNESDEKTSEMAQEEHFSEEEVEFIGEGPSRPVLECIDLVSDDESQALYFNGKSKDHVTATLDRLARNIEVQKKKQAEKAKAFQDKLNLQRAHGLQALALNKDRPGASAAKICVNQWLNMPGLKPGFVSANRRNFSQPREMGPINTEPITCPVMHCHRKFDNRPLLFGHLQRFDHSPCDPSIFLHGACDTSYVCLVCQHRFATSREYTAHLAAKVKLGDGHVATLPPLLVQCFACPSCFLLFYQRDNCLKHMSANNHFVRSIKLNGEKGIPCPVPIPSYAKRVLIALCKDIPFCVVCTSCDCELRSHMEVTAHFRTHCRKAGPSSRSEKTIVDVASIFRLYAFCHICKLGLKNEAHIAKHMARTSHKAKYITSIEESILAFCYLNEGIKTPSDFCLLASNDRLKLCTLKRSLNDTGDSGVLPKRMKESESDDGLKKEGIVTVTAWFCECSQQFSDEKNAEKHIMTANRISHKCMVCGKLADDASIIRLHMSRFHGGARLESFLFWCQMCQIELPRIENVLMHIVDCHGGHSFYYEQEVPEELPTFPEEDLILELPERDVTPSPPQQSVEGSWQCQICEEMFDTEETVKLHCRSLNIHQFHKFCCEICKKKFHKIDTLLRHCQLQHDAVVKIKYFCGLCEDLYFDEEAAFLGHYESFHSLDYTYVENQGQSNNKASDMALNICNEHEKQLTCGCLAKYCLKVRQKTDAKICLDRLFGKGKLWFSCTSCPATDQTMAGINTHLCKNKSTSSVKKVVVKCSICSKSFVHPQAAQSHYHVKHCFLNEPSNSYHFRTDESNGDMFTFTASGTSTDNLPASPEQSSANSSYMVENNTPNLSVARIDPVPKKIKAEAETMGEGNTESEPQNCELPDLDFLETMTHIVFIDLDNWSQFFSQLPGYLNQGTFVWGFQGGKSTWKPPMDCKYFKHLSTTGCFFLQPDCTDRKDVADIAICVHAERLDERLPKQIAFTVLSGDEVFTELENKFKKTQRSAQILNPHHVGGDVLCSLFNRISETTQDILDEDMEINSMRQDEDADIKEAIKRSLLEM